MAMKGIDISGHQAGIDLAAVRPSFVFVKATQGVDYTNPDCSRAVEQALSLGMPVGVYHYIDGSGARAEADFFVDHCTRWLGKVVWALDWEAGQNDAWNDAEYLVAVIARVTERTGTPPVVYASKANYPWPMVQAHGCTPWVAQYGDMEDTDWDDAPWSDGEWTAPLHQYSSTLVAPGWDGHLDANIFYGDRAAWDALVAGGNPGWYLEPDGVWAEKTGARFREVMGAPKSAPWKEVCKSFQRFLNWGLDAYGHQRAHGGFWVNEQGDDDRATWSAFQQWWNDSHVPAGHRIAVDGVYGPETVKAIQHALNHSWAGSKALALKP